MISVITGLVELLKTIGMSKKFAPLASLVIGLAAGILYTTGTLPEQILYGIVLGLSACGLYSGVKNTAEELQNKPEAFVPVVVEMTAEGQSKSAEGGVDNGPEGS